MQLPLFKAGTTGVNDNDLLFDLASEIQDFDTFQIMSTAGAMDVFVSLDGTNFSTAPYSLQDMGASDLLPVLVTVADRVYGFRGRFKAIQIRQNGVTAVTDPAIACGNL